MKTRICHGRAFYLLFSTLLLLLNVDCVKSTFSNGLEIPRIQVDSQRFDSESAIEYNDSEDPVQCYSHGDLQAPTPQKLSMRHTNRLMILYILQVVPQRVYRIAAEGEK
ncbi:hypothetical protein ABKN59_007330 [Abortiporus biennis]